MKLARPDIFHPHIVFAGCRTRPQGDGDDDGLTAALRTRGLPVRWLPWDHPDTLEADLVILRATWDYTERLDEFRDWTTRMRNLLNAPPVVAWNSDKHYLLDLAAAGVPTVPSRFFAPGEPVHLPPGETGDVVVKPAIGAGSVGAQRFSDPAAAIAHAEALHARGRAALVQPYDGRIAEGETALVFIAGRPSHAFAKGPMLSVSGAAPTLDDTGTYGDEKLSPADPDFEVWDVGHAALTAASAHLDIPAREFLYARVDVIGGRIDPRLLELELIEPSLGWRQLDDEARARQQRTFAVEVESALDRLGLGPFSGRPSP